MYQIQTNSKTILVERVEFVKRQDNGFIISCSESEAMGIVSDTNEGFYRLEGRDYLGDYEVAILEEISPNQELLKAQIAALEERGEFLEDIIAEMAMMIC